MSDPSQTSGVSDETSGAESDPPETRPEAAAEAAAAAQRRHKKKRLYGFIAMVVFVAGGFFLFGANVPKEVRVRFDLPPVSRSNFAEIPRARVALVTATIADTEGDNRVATINLPSPNGLTGPRTGPVVLRLKPGRYVVRAKIRSFEASEVPLEGLLTVDGDEAVVELK